MSTLIKAGTATSGAVVEADATGQIELQTGSTPTTAVTINTSQNVGIGTSSPSARLQVSGEAIFGGAGTYQTVFVNNNSTTGGGAFAVQQNGSTRGYYGISGAWLGDTSSDLGIAAVSSNIRFYTNNSSSERMRILSGGNVLIGKTADNTTTAGVRFSSTGFGAFTASDDLQIWCNRLSTDGTLILFQQDNTTEGFISVSGTTVSYNGGHLARLSQLPNNQKDDALLKGTVMSNLDDMCVWIKDDEVLPNEQLNKMKVSDVEGDTNVAGVFVSWDFDEQCQSDDMNVAMTGDMIIRIAEGVVVQKGDLLMSAGDGTAKPQGDDIVRSKTIAKVTSNHVTCTYEDGSYCVPCVLMAC